MYNLGGKQKMEIRIRDTMETTDNDKELLLDWTDDPKLAIDTGAGQWDTIFLEVDGDDLILMTPSGTIKIDMVKMKSGWDIMKSGWDIVGFYDMVKYSDWGKI